MLPSYCEEGNGSTDYQRRTKAEMRFSDVHRKVLGRLESGSACTVTPI
jgi:hypothetical protein